MTNIDDKYIVEHLFNNGCSIFGYIKHKLDKEILDYLYNRYTDSQSTKETLYRIYHNIEQRPCCPKCGQPVKFTGKKFNQYCSRSCSIDNTKIKEAIKTKYGVDNISQLDAVKKKVKQTVQRKYGVNNALLLGQDKSITYRKENNNKVQQKRKSTCIEKYGVDNVAKDSNVKKKIKTTCVKKYGVYPAVKTDNVKAKLSNSIKLSIPKRTQTMKLNGTIGNTISKAESVLYNKICINYPDCISQYTSEEYPFNCDFYIPSLNLYIEFNNHWTHGGHPYDSTNKFDIEKLQKWKNKNTPYYDNAITTWTIRDVQKRAIAKQNKLNFIEIWDINEFDDRLNSFLNSIK